jgi:nitrous oxidase accessory protein NosD
VTNGFIYNNTLIDQEDLAISIERSSKIWVLSNFINNTGLNGLEVEESSFIKLEANVFSNIDRTAIVIQRATKNFITMNNLSFDKIGITLASVRKTLVSNNRLIALESDDTLGKSIGIETIMGYGLPTAELEISGNHFTECDLGAILWMNNSIFTGNTVTFSETGFLSDASSSNLLFGNMVSNASEIGIEVCAPNNLTITDNYLINNRGIGIACYRTHVPSPTVTISENWITNQGGDGIQLNGYEYSRIFRNTVINCSDYGIRIAEGSYFNLVKENSFRDNNRGGIQGFDDETTGNNTFELNYWSDWTSPDVDSNGVVDTPYSLDGDANNEDPLPFTISSAHLSKPLIVFPSGGEIFTTVMIPLQWTPVTDSLGHDVKYSVYISTNLGFTWDLLASQLENTAYDWDTTSFPQSTKYMVKIVATDSAGFLQEDSSNRPFILHSPLPNPHLISPKGGESLELDVPIIWTVVNDSMGHDISYNLYYSLNNGSTWLLIRKGLTSNQYIWDTTLVANNRQVLLKIQAVDDLGLASEAIIGEPVAIWNHLLSPLRLLSPPEGATLNGSVPVSWTEVVCNQGHTVLYTVRLSSDGGVNFEALINAINLHLPNYTWDTTLELDGSDYKLQVTAQDEGGLDEVITSIFPLTIINSKPPDIGFLQRVLVLVSALAVAAVAVSAYFFWRSSRLKKELLTKEEELRRYAAMAKRVWLQAVEENNGAN